MAVQHALPGILHVAACHFLAWSSSSSPSARPPVPGLCLDSGKLRGGNKGKRVAQGEQGCEELERVPGLLGSGLLCNLGDPFHL